MLYPNSPLTIFSIYYSFVVSFSKTISYYIRRSRNLKKNTFGIFAQPTELMRNIRECWNQRQVISTEPAGIAPKYFFLNKTLFNFYALLMSYYI